MQQKSRMDAIEELRQKDIAASKAFNVDRLVSLWTEDGILIPPGTDVVRGKAAIRDMLSARAETEMGKILEYEYGK